MHHFVTHYEFFQLRGIPCVRMEEYRLGFSWETPSHMTVKVIGTVAKYFDWQRVPSKNSQHWRKTECGCSGTTRLTKTDILSDTIEKNLHLHPHISWVPPGSGKIRHILYAVSVENSIDWIGVATIVFTWLEYIELFIQPFYLL